ncbi:MAG TPA: hypothetical protein RMH99_27300 [Sandaracinaceae bacterium LLY-WYZ-13_1]|nr:hypothetical protein [Sandaracinaceae bacterium LLY-WYZ-13_1]
MDASKPISRLALATVAAACALAPRLAAAQACPNATARPPIHDNNAYRRYHASSCWVETDFMQDYGVSEHGTTNQSSGLEARRRDVYCPIINDELLSRHPDNDYTQVVLSASDQLSGNDDSIVVASHCVAHPFSLSTSCDPQVFTGQSCYGDTGDWLNPGTSDPYECVNIAFGTYTLNLPVTFNEEHAEWYSYIGVSLAKESKTAISGYEVSACLFGAECPELDCIGS